MGNLDTVAGARGLGAPPGSQTDGQPLRVLLVDDKEDYYIATREMLSQIDGGRYELDWVSNSQGALSAFVSNDYDVCLIDYCVSGQSGLDLLDEAARLGCSASMILLTAQPDHQFDIKAMNAGAADYLVKSEIDAFLLERSIRYAVERDRGEAERSALEQQLRQSQKMEAVGQLSGGIAHDFNNLLTAILGHSQLGAAAVPQGTRLKTYLDEVYRAAQRAACLTDQLLAFSRRQFLEQRVLNLNDLMFSIQQMLRHLAGHDIELTIVSEHDLGQVKADPGQISQVLINLVINARDAMPGGGRLTIETSNACTAQESTPQLPDLAPGQYVVVAVSDNGIGMTKDVEARIFEPFFTTKEQGRGTGLGLSTCYGIVRQSGGHIWVDSEPGRGTTFKIYLPRLSSVVNGAPDNAGSEKQQAGEEKVLLVEDEESVRIMMAGVLRDHGYTVFEAANGGEALSVALELGDTEIDLLITDIVMPLIGGEELAGRLRARKAVKKVLYTSGYTDAVINPRDRVDPLTDFISKPFTPDSLSRRVREVLDRPARDSSKPQAPRSPGKPTQPEQPAP